MLALRCWCSVTWGRLHNGWQAVDSEILRWPIQQALSGPRLGPDWPTAGPPLGTVTGRSRLQYEPGNNEAFGEGRVSSVCARAPQSRALPTPRALPACERP